MFDVYLLALLTCIFSLNAADHPIKKDSAKIYEFFVRDASGKAATAFYLSKQYSVVDKLPSYAKDSKIINNRLVKKEDINRALFHGTHELLVTQDIKHASASSGVSLALSALWNTADHFGLSQYIATDSDVLNAFAYGFIHSLCLLVAQEQINKLS